MDYKKINDKYKKYKLNKKKESMKEICKPKNFKLQPQQKFLSEYFTNTASKKGLLIYHKIGAGKTCTAISICENLKKKMNILIVLPASLINNFRNELRSKCPGDNYISNEERNLLKKYKPSSRDFKKIIKKSDNEINKYYTIYSYHKFVDLCYEKKIKLKNTLLVIDEVQNMVSESGTFYKNLKNVIDKSDELTRILLLSATPIFDKPVEIALTLNLLKIKNELPVGNDFNKMFLKCNNVKNNVVYEMKNIEKFKNYSKGLVSYYRGAQQNAFPKDIFKIVRCKMEKFQYKSYLTALSISNNMLSGFLKKTDILKLSNNFMLGPRIISNISFPNKGIEKKGFLSLKGSVLKQKNIKNFSKKFYKINNKINKSTGPVFIYSNFRDYGGMKSLIKFLEYNGYKNYKVYGEGKKRYALWSGDETNVIKNEINMVFNKKNNMNGNKIKIILGTPSIKEGVSLLRVEQVHIIEPYWNMSRIKQIIGRAIRFCSHKDMSRDRRFVEIYLYLAVYPGLKTVDQIIWSMAKRKQKLIDNFEKTLKETAIDCNLFYHRNVYKNDEPLNCVKT